MCVCVYVYKDTHVLQCKCGDQRTICLSWFFPSTVGYQTHNVRSAMQEILPPHHSNTDPELAFEIKT